MTGKLFSYSIENSPDTGTGFCFSGRHYDLNKSLFLCPVLRGSSIPVLSSIVVALKLVNSDPGILKKLYETIEEQRLQKECLLPEGWKFAAPLIPSKIIAVGRNYDEHAREMGNSPPREPLLFAKLPSSIIAHEEAIVIPENIGRVDHEIELAVIIGEKTRKVSPKAALKSIAGYTVFNDITARDMQKTESSQGKPWMRAKGFDTFGPCGPYVVPEKLLPDIDSLELKLSVNGKTKQRGNTRDMLFSVVDLIAFISNTCTLSPGDLIITGTPAGVSQISPGDIVSAEIEAIGILENPVIKES